MMNMGPSEQQLKELDTMLLDAFTRNALPVQAKPGASQWKHFGQVAYPLVVQQFVEFTTAWWEEHHTDRGLQLSVFGNNVQRSLQYMAAAGKHLLPSTPVHYLLKQCRCNTAAQHSVSSFVSQISCCAL